MSKFARRQQRSETKRRWKELGQYSKEPGFSGFCEEARGEYEIGEVACCAECHADTEVLSRAEDGDRHFVVCCAVRHTLCPNDGEKRLHPEAPRAVAPAGFTPEHEAS